MTTLKKLRSTAKEFGLKMSGKKSVLESRISDYFSMEREYIKRMSRAERLDKYKALRGLVKDDNQFKNELLRFKSEVAASVRFEKIKNEPHFLELCSKAAKKIKLRENNIIERDLVEHGRRTKTWKLINNLNISTIDRFMSKLESIETAFHLRFTCDYQLHNMENEEFMSWRQHFGTHFFVNLSTARDWLVKKEEERLSRETINRPSTKWNFDKWIEVSVKAIVTNEVLLGAGKLPDWLRNKKGVFALDTYDDNLCVLRCLALHQGTRVDRCTEKAIALGKELHGMIVRSGQKYL